MSGSSEEDDCGTGTYTDEETSNEFTLPSFPGPSSCSYLSVGQVCATDVLGRGYVAVTVWPMHVTLCSFRPRAHAPPHPCAHGYGHAHKCLEGSNACTCTSTRALSPRPV
eukprot:355556-Chlamydomonas_euryale.AAC.4